MFIIGTLLALGIARYNESNKLFWILFISFIMGIAAVNVLDNAFGKKEQSSESFNQAYPTQGLCTVDNAFVCIFEDICTLATVKETSKLVSKAYTPDYVESLATLSDVSGATQGLYIHALANPPNTVEIVNDS